MTSSHRCDPLDARLLLALATDPRATTTALAERSGLSRNTVQARLARMEQASALGSLEKQIDPAILGYPLRAYVLTNVTQRKLTAVAAALNEIPEVLEVSGLSGVADLLIQVAAQNADDLYRVAGRILGIKGVKRTSTALVMRDLVDYRVTPLIRSLVN